MFLKKILTLIFFTILTGNVYAFKVSPIEIEFEPDGTNSTQTIRLENDKDKNIPIEIEVLERLHKNGKEIRKPTKDFSFFPKQLILKPKEKRNIRISWMGERQNIDLSKTKSQQFLINGNRRIKTEKAYRLEVKQVPVNLKRKRTETGIDFIYNYIASLYVKPVNSKADLIVTRINRLSNNELVAAVSNRGSSHAILAQYSLYAKSEKSSDIEILADQVDEVRGINLLPNESRLIKFKLPIKTSSEKLSLKFKKL